MSETHGDVLMMLVQGGRAIAAGGTSRLNDSDSMLSDFSAGRFFEIEDFSLGLNLSDFESDQNRLAAPATQVKPPHDAGHNREAAAAAAPQKSKFASWRDKRKSRQAVAALAFPVDLDPFSFTRRVDRASPLLFESCASTTTFDSATIVKRKVTGQKLALQGYLRIDFTGVLLIGLTWDDGEMLKEKCRFICRGVKVQYRVQSSDGTLGAAASADWTQAMSLRTAQG